MSYPVFASGDVLNASDMNAVGLWLVKTQTVGTGVSSVTVTGAFSADYDNYQIMVANVDSSVADNVYFLTFGNSAGNVYYSAVSWRSWANVAAGAGYNGVATGIALGLTDTQNSTFATISIGSPFLNAYTSVVSNGQSQNFQSNAGGVHAYTASQTSFTLNAPAGQTWTGGTIRVYGMRN